MKSLASVVWCLVLNEPDIIKIYHFFGDSTPNPKHQTRNLVYICRMEVNDQLVDKLAHLSRLKFNDAEREGIKKDLQRMIGFVEKLNELDLDDVEPLLHVSDEVNVLREDELKGSISREEALKNAPGSDEEFFRVPKVIKK